MPKQNFRQTQALDVPKDWRVVQLNEVATIRGNKSMSNSRTVPFIPMELVQENSLFVEYQIRNRSDVKSFTYCEDGDLLLAKSTPSLENGKQGIVKLGHQNKFALATTEVFPIQTTGIHNVFLFYILKHPKFRAKIILSMIGTTGRQRASKESVEKLQIPLPPLPEQQSISEILSSVDDAISLVERERRAVERLKVGIMKKLLDVKGWERVKFETVCTKIRSGGTPLTSKKDYYNGNIPFVKIEDITNAGKYLTETQSKISQKGLDNSTAWVVPKGSLLLAIYGSMGEITITQIDVATNQAILGIILDKNIADTEYIYYFFKNVKLARYAKRSTQANLTAEIIRSIELHLPPLEEQKRIAEILSTLDQKLSLQSAQKQKLERIKQGLMNDLLTGKKRVKVD